MRSYCQPSSVESYRGSAISVDMTHCRKPYNTEQWKAVVSEEEHLSPGGTTKGSGQASHCRHCNAMQTTEADMQPSQQRRLPECPNDALASQDCSLLFVR